MIASCIMAAALLVAAQAPVATGSPYSLVAADGGRVDAARVFAGGRRLVVYAAPAIDPSARLVEALRAWSQANPARWRERLIVIVAAPAADAGVWLREHWGADDLPAWFADPDASAWRGLNFQGSLGVAGMDDGRVDWKLDGVIDDPAVLERPATSWIEGGAR